MQVARLGIERLEKARLVQVAAGPHEHVITHHYRRRRRKVLLAVVGDRFVPALLAGFGVERYQVVLGHLKVEGVAVHGHAAIADVIAAPGRPDVMPQHRAVVCIHGPGVVGRRDVEDAIYLQDRAGDAWGATARTRYGDRCLGDAAHYGRGDKPGRPKTSPCTCSTTRSSGQRYALQASVRSLTFVRLTCSRTLYRRCE